MRLFIVRHGQSTANLAKTYAGQSDVPLTEQGRLQAQAIQPILADIPFDRVYSSDLIRAIDTQKLALPGRECIRLPLLREMDIGKLTGMLISEARKQYAGHFHHSYNYTTYFGGETMQDIQKRAASFLQLLEEDPCENVIAFTHNGFIRSLLDNVLKASVPAKSVVIANCSIHVFDFDGQVWRLAAWNYMKNL